MRSMLLQRLKKTVLSKLSKYEVILAFQNMLQDKIDLAKKVLEDTIASRNSESKSSAGDKYETGRAMAQIAQQQNEILLSELLKQHHQIAMINPYQIASKIEFGSLIETKSIWFLVSIGVGNIEIEKENVYSISITSPLGSAFQGKTSGDYINFNGRKYEIISVS